LCGIVWYNSTFSHFSRTLTCDRQTHVDGIYHANIALHVVKREAKHNIAQKTLRTKARFHCVVWCPKSKWSGLTGLSLASTKSSISDSAAFVRYKIACTAGFTKVWVTSVAHWLTQSVANQVQFNCQVAWLTYGNVSVVGSQLSDQQHYPHCVCEVCTGAADSVRSPITRLHRSATYVDVAYCYRQSSTAWSVCLSVFHSVTIVSPAKMAEPIEYDQLHCKAVNHGLSK